MPYLVAAAQDLTAWTQHLALDGDLARLSEASWNFDGDPRLTIRR
mgnify:CR=1 FL=1